MLELNITHTKSHTIYPFILFSECVIYSQYLIIILDFAILPINVLKQL